MISFGSLSLASHLLSTHLFAWFPSRILLFRATSAIVVAAVYARLWFLSFINPRLPHCALTDSNKYPRSAQTEDSERWRRRRLWRLWRRGGRGGYERCGRRSVCPSMPVLRILLYPSLFLDAVFLSSLFFFVHMYIFSSRSNLRTSLLYLVWTTG